MKIKSCQNLTNTENMFYSSPTIHKLMPNIHIQTQHILLTPSDSQTDSMWFTSTKQHSRTKAFCFANKKRTYKETFIQLQKISLKYKLKSLKYKKNSFEYKNSPKSPKKSFKYKKQSYNYEKLSRDISH